MYGQQFSYIVSVMVVFGQIATLVLAVLLMRDYRARTRDALTAWIHRHGLSLAFIVAAGGVVASFIYSDVIGFTPCALCWYQRAFMIPLAVVLAIAAWRKDRSIIPYALALAGIGAIIALDHTWLQVGGSSFIPCAATGPTCEQRYVFEFGYITIPVMSLTGFAFIAALLGHAKVQKS